MICKNITLKAGRLFLKHENDVVYHSVIDNLERGVSESYFRDDIDVNVLGKNARRTNSFIL